jgi:hypothetical protein
MQILSGLIQPTLLELRASILLFCNIYSFATQLICLSYNAIHALSRHDFFYVSSWEITITHFGVRDLASREFLRNSWHIIFYKTY